MTDPVMTDDEIGGLVKEARAHFAQDELTLANMTFTSKVFGNSLSDTLDSLQAEVRRLTGGFILDHAEVPSGEHCHPNSPHCSKLVYVARAATAPNTGE